jgi:hypothetical protein
MGELIQRGEQGMEGVLWFSKYFVEKCGVSVDESSHTFYVYSHPPANDTPKLRNCIQ